MKWSASTGASLNTPLESSQGQVYSWLNQGPMAKASPAVIKITQCRNSLKLEVDEAGVSIGDAAQNDEGNRDDLQQRGQDWAAFDSLVKAELEEEEWNQDQDSLQFVRFVVKTQREEVLNG